MRLELMLGTRYLMAKRRLSSVSIITFLCVVGIISGILTLITVLSVMNGFQQEIRDKILGMRAHIEITPYQTMSLSLKNKGSQGLSNYQEVVDLAYEVPEVTFATPYISDIGIVEAPTRTLPIALRAFEKDIFKQDTNLSRCFIFTNNSSGDLSIPDTALVGIEMKKNLNLRVGDPLKVVVSKGDIERGEVVSSSKTFTIRGIFETGYYEYDSRLVIIPLATAQKITRFGGNVTGVSVKVQDSMKAGQIAEKLKEKTYRALSIQPWMLFERNFFEALHNEKVLMTIVLFLIVFIATFNIATTQIVFVKDKRREIAILKTLGLKPFNIAQAFFLEGTIIGFMGTVLGVAAGLYATIHINETLAIIESLFQIAFDTYYHIVSAIRWAAEVPGTPFIAFALAGVFIAIPFLTKKDGVMKRLLFGAAGIFALVFVAEIAYAVLSPKNLLDYNIGEGILILFRSVPLFLIILFNVAGALVALSFLFKKGTKPQGVLRNLGIFLFILSAFRMLYTLTQQMPRVSAFFILILATIGCAVAFFLAASRMRTFKRGRRIAFSFGAVVFLVASVLFAFRFTFPEPLFLAFLIATIAVLLTACVLFLVSFATPALSYRKKFIIAAGTLVSLFFAVQTVFFHIVPGRITRPVFPTLFPRDVYYLSGLPYIIDPGQVVMIAGISFLLSVLFALVPSIIASRNKPAMVLRYE